MRMNHAVRQELPTLAERDQSSLAPGQAGMGHSVYAEPLARAVAGGGPWTAALQGTGRASTK
jgi:hypothetical protein